MINKLTKNTLLVMSLLTSAPALAMNQDLTELTTSIIKLQLNNQNDELSESVKPLSTKQAFEVVISQLQSFMDDGDIINYFKTLEKDNPSVHHELLQREEQKDSDNLIYLALQHSRPSLLRYLTEKEAKLPSVLRAGDIESKLQDYFSSRSLSKKIQLKNGSLLMVPELYNLLENRSGQAVANRVFAFFLLRSFLDVDKLVEEGERFAGFYAYHWPALWAVGVGNEGILNTKVTFNLVQNLHKRYPDKLSQTAISPNDIKELITPLHTSTAYKHIDEVIEKKKKEREEKKRKKIKSS